MTVPSTTRRAGPYFGNDATTSFPFTFKVFGTSDVALTLTDAGGVTSTLVLDTDYSIALNPDQDSSPGGSITYPLSGAPLGIGETLVGVGAVPYDQTTDLPSGGPYRATTIENTFDRTVFQIQQLAESQGRSLTLSPSAATGVSTILPAPQANKVLGWNLGENALINVDNSGGGGGTPLPALVAGQYLSNNGTDLLWAAVSSAPGFKRLKADYGLVGNGTTDDTTAYVAAIAAAAEGTALIYDGYFRITDNVVINKRLSHICFGANQGVIVDVGTSKDGLTFLGTSAPLQLGLNDMTIALNVYGKANCCRHAVVMQRGDRSNFVFNIRAGATAYGLRVRGCLINKWDISSTVNYAPPADLPITPGTQANHIVVDNYGVPTSAFTNVTVSGPASPGVVTWVAHGFSADQTLVFRETGTAPPSPFTPGKPYFLRPVDADHFQLSEIRGGTAINTSTAGTSPAMATCAAIASNDNDFRVVFEGAAAGFVQAPMPGEGTNTLRGQIEGITGAPFFVEDSLGFTIKDLKMEANGVASTIKNSISINIGSGVAYLGDVSHPSTINIQNCRGYTLNGGYSKISIDSASRGGQGGGWAMPTISDFVCLDTSFVQTGPIVNSADATVMTGPGHPTMENVHHNPYYDIWASAGTSAAPLGSSIAGGGFVSRVTSPRYPGNPNIYSARVTTAAAGIGNGFVSTPSFSPVAESGWISIFAPVYVATGQPGVRVFIFDGTQYNFVGENTTTKDAWIEFRGSCKMIAGQQISAVVVPWDGSTYPSGAQYYCGGLSMCFGSLAPQHLADHGKRRANIISTIANTPDFVGQLALSGTDMYMSIGNATSGDWKKITP